MSSFTRSCFALSFTRSKFASALYFIGFAFLSATSPSFANPVLDSVAAGAATVQQSQNLTTIQQSSAKAIINWQSFNIGAQETTNFVQPQGGVTLNRINPNQGASEIYGHLTSNGQIILVNGAGVYFGPNSSVNVGSIIVSAAGISDQNFLAGTYLFDQAAGLRGSIVNDGSIKAADNGLVALMGNAVVNHGVIEANLGQIVLASGETFTVGFDQTGLVNFSINQATSAKGLDKDGNAINDGVSNTGSVLANGGKILITARSAANVLDNVINLDGVIVANSVSNQNGTIVIDGGSQGQVKVAAKLSAAGRKAGETGGTIKVLGENITIAAPALITASGMAGGGTVEIGGDRHGLGPDLNALTVTMEQGAAIHADALLAGNGGEVIIWSDLDTQVHGLITAIAGSLSGNGGFVETSGQVLNVDNIQVITSAIHGLTGTWLLDPTNLFIADSPTDAENDGMNTNYNSAAASGSTTYTSSNPSTDSYLNTTALENSLANNSVVIQTANGGSIVLVTDLVWNVATSLTLQSAANIILNGNISASAGTLHLDAASSSTPNIYSSNSSLVANSAGVITTIAVGSFFLDSGYWSQAPTQASALPTFSVSTDFEIAPQATFLRAAQATGSSPYEIDDVFGLQGVASGALAAANYTLGQDIDASATDSWTEGFKPLGSAGEDTDGTSGGYTGTFNGQSHTIFNLSIASDTNMVGLFALLKGGSIQNLNIANATYQNLNYSSSFANPAYVGGIAGLVNGHGSISNSSFSGTLNFNTAVSGGYMGGLVGQVVGGQLSQDMTAAVLLINDNLSNGAVTALGGLAGGLTNSTVSNVYSSGKVIVTNTAGDPLLQLGGIAGNLTNSSLSTSYTTGVVFDGYSTAINPVVGVKDANSSLTNVFYDSDTTIPATAEAAVGLTDLMMRVQTSFTGFDFTNVWGMGTYPQLINTSNAFLPATTNFDFVGKVAPNTTLSVFVGSALAPVTTTSGTNGLFDLSVPTSLIASSAPYTAFVLYSDATMGDFVSMVSNPATSFYSGSNFTLAPANTIQVGDEFTNAINTNDLINLYTNLNDPNNTLLFSGTGTQFVIGNSVSPNTTLFTTPTTTLTLGSGGSGSLSSVGNATLTLNGPSINYTDSISLGSGGIFNLNADLNGATDIETAIDLSAGQINLNANVTNIVGQDYSGLITILKNVTLSSQIITIGSASWSTAYALTINANSQIAINGSINAPLGSLILSTPSANQSGSITDNSSVNVGTFNLLSGFWSQTSPSPFQATNFIINSSNAQFLRVLGGGEDGSNGNPYQIYDIYGLEGINSSATPGFNGSNLSLNYIQMNDIDASPASTWQANAGFIPIGTFDNPFSGTYNGQNFKITNLNINELNLPNLGTTNFAASAVGLFGVTGDNGIIENTNVVGATYVTSNQVSSGSGNIGGFKNIGGLVGVNQGTIENSSFLGNITALNTVATSNQQTYFVGGLVGFDYTDVDGGIISGSWSRGQITVIQANNGTDNIGGLAGGLAGGVAGNLGPGLYSISNSFSNSFIRFSNQTFDLQTGAPAPMYGITLNNSNQTTLGGSFGGLVGISDGQITQSYSGGIVDILTTSVGQDTNSGVSHFGYQTIGGFIGNNSGGITDSYSTTGVIDNFPNANDLVGGFVGDNFGTIARTFSTGVVIVNLASLNGNLTNNDGNALQGYAFDGINDTAANSAASIVGSFYDIDTAGVDNGNHHSASEDITPGCFSGTCMATDSSGIAIVDLSTQSTYPSDPTNPNTYWSFANDPNNNSTPVWGIMEGVSYPYLIPPAGTANSPIVISGMAAPNSIANSTNISYTTLVLPNPGANIQDYYLAGANGSFYYLEQNLPDQTPILVYANQQRGNVLTFTNVNQNILNLAPLNSTLQLGDSNVNSFSLTQLAAVAGPSSDILFTYNSGTNTLTLGNAQTLGSTVQLVSTPTTTLDLNANVVTQTNGQANIILNGPLSTSLGSLTLAANNISLNGALSFSSSSVSLAATSNIYLNNSIFSNFGTLTLAAGAGSAGTDATEATITSGTAAALSATGVTATISVNNLIINAGQWFQENMSLPSLSVNSNFSLASGAQFIRVLSGTGATGSPFLVTDSFGLQGIQSNPLTLSEAWALNNDISLANTTSWSAGQGFNSIGSCSYQTGTCVAFTGTFDGQSHNVTNLTISFNNNFGAGLFGAVNGGTIENVNVTNANIVGLDAVGILAGYVTNSTITNTSAMGTVSGEDVLFNGQYYGTGGLIGAVQNSSVSKSFAIATVNSDSQAGGLIGSVLANSTLTNVYSQGSVNGLMSTGGLVGRLANSTITNAYAAETTSTVPGPSDGGLIGASSSSTVINSFWDVNTSGYGTDGSTADSAGGLGESTAHMMQISTFCPSGLCGGDASHFDFVNTWYMVNGSTYPSFGTGTLPPPAGGIPPVITVPPVEVSEPVVSVNPNQAIVNSMLQTEQNNVLAALDFLPDYVRPLVIQQIALDQVYFDQVQVLANCQKKPGSDVRSDLCLVISIN